MKYIMLKNKAIQDACLVLLVSTFLYSLAALSDVFGALEGWSRSPDRSAPHLDDLILMLAGALVASVVFFGRRWMDLDAEDRRRKRSELLLRKSRMNVIRKHGDLKELFRQVEAVKNEWERTVDCLEEMVVLTDNAGKVHRCNRPFKEFTGKPYGEILGKEIEALLGEHGIAPATCPGETVLSRCERNGKVYEIRSYNYTDVSTVSTQNIAGAVIIIRESREGAVAAAGPVSAEPVSGASYG